MVGIVTTKEGQPLKKGEIAGKEIPGHDMYQNPGAFVDHGGGTLVNVLLANLIRDSLKKAADVADAQKI